MPFKSPKMKILLGKNSHPYNSHTQIYKNKVIFKNYFNRKYRLLFDEEFVTELIKIFTHQLHILNIHIGDDIGDDINMGDEDEVEMAGDERILGDQEILEDNNGDNKEENKEEEKENNDNEEKENNDNEEKGDIMEDNMENEEKGDEKEEKTNEEEKELEEKIQEIERKIIDHLYRFWNFEIQGPEK